MVDNFYGLGKLVNNLWGIEKNPSAPGTPERRIAQMLRFFFDHDLE
jgi:hypothetical protein